MSLCSTLRDCTTPRCICPVYPLSLSSLFDLLVLLQTNTYYKLGVIYVRDNFKQLYVLMSPILYMDIFLDLEQESFGNSIYMYI